MREKEREREREHLEDAEKEMKERNAHTRVVSIIRFRRRREERILPDKQRAAPL